MALLEQKEVNQGHNNSIHASKNISKKMYDDKLHEKSGVGINEP